jgi:uncharacterized protein (DUF1501 family)
MTTRRGTSAHPSAAYGALCAPDPDPAALTRRQVLGGLLGLAGAGALGASLPAWAEAAGAAPLPAEAPVLVVLVADGGNDFLNTVPLTGAGRYHDLRRGLAIPDGTALPLGDGFHLHPELRWCKEEWDAGRLAVVNGVGDPARDRSHFASLTNLMAGHAAGGQTAGWIGRYLDAVNASPLAGVSIGDNGIPFQFRRARGSVVGLPLTGSLFGANPNGNQIADRSLLRAVRAVARRPPALGPWADAVVTTQRFATEVAAAVEPAYQAVDDTPADRSLERKLRLATALIELDIGAHVVGMAHTDFDNHADLRPNHDALLTELDRGLRQFFQSLDDRWRRRTVVLVISEFGRRPGGNGSRGVDHGTAGASLLVGPRVRGGLYGEYPSLRRLDPEGDLIHTTDFRRVYASVLGPLLGSDPQALLGGDYADLGVIR